MKNYSKIISVLLTIAILATIAVIPGSALATEITAGNTKETATNIPQYSIDYVSSLSKAEEVDWFKFTTLSEDAYYHFYFENYSLANTGTNWATESPNLYLYDANMKELEHSFTDSDYKDSFSLKLENDTVYYFKVLMGSKKTNSIGNYQITLSYKPDNAPDAKNLANPISLNNRIISSFDGYGDMDWYSFTTNNTDTDYTITLVNYDLPNTYTNWAEDSPNIFLYDINNQELGSCYTKPENKQGSIKVTLNKNQKYFLKLFMGEREKDATGNYEFIVSCDSIDTPVTTKTLSSISVDTLPAKIQYTVGEELDTNGMVVRAKYSDGTSAVVTNYEVYGFDSSKAGTSVVRVSYSENGTTKTTAFSVTINEADTQAPDDNNGGFSFDTVIEFFNGILEFFANILDFIINLFYSFA